MAASKATNCISLAISRTADEALSAEECEYTDFVQVERGEQGQVLSLSFRTSESTRFKRIVTEQMIASLEAIRPDELAVPLGNLTGLVFLSALGPSVRIQIHSVGDLTAEYVSEFSASGVNQTRHAIYLKVSAVVYLLIPGEILPIEVEQRVCVAETVIVGQVPDTYLNLQDGASKDE